jgi:hypothetical protein
MITLSIETEEERMEKRKEWSQFPDSFQSLPKSLCLALHGFNQQQQKTNVITLCIWASLLDIQGN